MPKKKIKNSVVITAAGNGTRFGTDKLLMEINGKKILEKSIEAFLLPIVDEIVVVANATKLSLYEKLLKEKFPQEKRIRIIDGQGKERWQSSLAGIKASKGEIVAIHDGARPLIKKKTIVESFKVAEKTGAALVAARATDSIKIVDQKKDNYDAANREQIWQAQTPQVFKRKLILQAYDRALEANYQKMTDESELVTKFLQKKVRVVENDHKNLKVTFPFDLEIARLIDRDF